MKEKLNNLEMPEIKKLYRTLVFQNATLQEKYDNLVAENLDLLKSAGIAKEDERADGLILTES